MAPDRLRARAAGPLRGDIVVPGDKSISHRLLILGALAEGETRVRGLLESLDVLHTAEALRAFGATVERDDAGLWRVRGAEWKSPAVTIDCGNSGTAARLLMGAAAGFPLEATFTGDASLRARPMTRVLDPLSAMGALVLQSEQGRLPVTLRGGSLEGISYDNVHASAQVKSAILLAGLRAAGTAEVTEPRPSRDHTERMLRSFGCDIDVSAGTVRLSGGQRLCGTEIEVPADPSSAAFPLVAALLTPGSSITLRSVLVNPLRTGLFATLQEMGAAIRFDNCRSLGGEQVADIHVEASPLHGVEVPACRVPAMVDEFPILAVAAAFARGRTVMRGLAELRVKESDRLAAIVNGLRAAGITCGSEGDDLFVEGGRPKGGAAIAAGGDHRIAMSFLVLGTASEQPVEVDSAATIPTSFPNFAETMRTIGADIQ